MIQWESRNVLDFGYANKIYSNEKWNYIVVPKCASSIIRDKLNMVEGEKVFRKRFTFVRHPYERLKSFLYQEQCFDIDVINKKIKSVLHNWDNNDPHCVAYSLYINQQDFNFIGTLENFNEDFKHISNIKIKNNSIRKESNDPQEKAFNEKVDHLYNEAFNYNSKQLTEAYAKDLILFNEVLNDNINNRSIH